MNDAHENAEADGDGFYGVRLVGIEDEIAEDLPEVFFLALRKKSRGFT